MSEEMNFKDKIVLITGASSGIGAETAIHFAREGASLCITGRDETRLAETARKCREVANGGKIQLVCDGFRCTVVVLTRNNKIVQILADLSKVDACDSIFSTFAMEFDRLDVLVNNAGIAIITDLESATMDEYDSTFNVNVKAIFHLTKLAIPYLKLVKGCIVNVSSCVSLCAYRGFTLYGMTKAAIDYFTKSTALELASSGVRVNAINPGAAETSIHAKRFGNSKQALNEYYKTMTDQSPLGRVVSVSEVAASILYLSSEAAASITGTCLLMDAGLNLS